MRWNSFQVKCCYSEGGLLEDGTEFRFLLMAVLLKGDYSKDGTTFRYCTFVCSLGKLLGK